MFKQASVSFYNKKIFAVLFFSIFNATLGVGIVIPLLPVYAHDLGASGFYISMIFGSFSISRTFFLPYFGKRSDKYGRKPFIAIGLFCYTLISLAFIYFNSMDSLIIIRFMQGIASAMIMPVTQAYVGDITPKGKEGYYMGLFNMSIFISLSIGPLAGGYISDFFDGRQILFMGEIIKDGLTVTFLCMGILSTVAFLASIIFLPHKSLEKKKSKNQDDSWSKFFKDNEILSIFIFRMGYTICIAIIWCFIPVFADKEFNLSSGKIGVLVTSGVFLSGILNTPLGHLADKISRRKMVNAGGFIVAISLALIFISNSFYDLIFAVFVFGIGGGISMPALMAIAVRSGNRVKAMGSVMGILTLGQSMGMLTGSLIAGITMDYLELRYAFLLGSLIIIVSTFLFNKFYTNT
ncbi:MAG: MFS transporter [Desulfobacterales bacterium]|nr:MFS transporter [Desulfobacterales bacterium]